ncbi:MAG: hypothetical protein GY786_08455, partial [Proteobacteria bacterium]|nr:hypothetical protein [Pseudomonadota bacterium]
MNFPVIRKRHLFSFYLSGLRGFNEQKRFFVRQAFKTEKSGAYFKSDSWKKKSDTRDETSTEPLPGWERISPMVWKRSVEMNNPLTEPFNNSLLLPDGATPDECIFYDTETTGLSTGAGTIPFLIGIGRLKRGCFEVVQYFLLDYPGEIEMLHELKKGFIKKKYY